MSKFCSMCGNQIEDDAIFCNQCGAKQIERQEQSSPVEPMPVETVSVEPTPVEPMPAGTVDEPITNQALNLAGKKYHFVSAPFMYRILVQNNNRKSWVLNSENLYQALLNYGAAKNTEVF